MVASADRLPAAPRDFATRARRLLGHVGESTEQIERSVAAAAILMEEVQTAVGR
jgi:hypothetical protein